MVVCPSHNPFVWHTLLKDPVKLYLSLHENMLVEPKVVVVNARLPLAGAGNWPQSTTTIQNYYQIIKLHVHC